jgi:hypothetical protein
MKRVHCCRVLVVEQETSEAFVLRELIHQRVFLP